MRSAYLLPLDSLEIASLITGLYDVPTGDETGAQLARIESLEEALRWGRKHLRAATEQAMIPIYCLREIQILRHAAKARGAQAPDDLDRVVNIEKELNIIAAKFCKDYGLFGLEPEEKPE